MRFIEWIGLVVITCPLPLFQVRRSFGLLVARYAVGIFFGQGIP